MSARWVQPKTERDARVELAAAYRMAAILGWTDLGATHFSVRVPGEDDAYLILAQGLFFDEVTATNLVKVGFDGVARSAGQLNPAGVTIHSALHGGGHEVFSVLHTHTPAGVAVTNHPDGLLPLSQHAMRFFGGQGMHDYEGVALDDDEGPRLAANLGTHELLLLRNHGLIAAGPDLPLAFSALYYAEFSAQIQVATLSTTSTPVLPDEATCIHTRSQYLASSGYAYRDWMGLLRAVERTHPDFAE